MAAPIAAFVQLPSDASNVGKKIRTQTRVVGADTVHEHFMALINPHSITGLYYAHSGILTIPTGAHNGTTTGHMWLINPSGSTVKGCMRSVMAVANIVLMTTADLTICRQVVALVTFTGTASGATITPAKRDSTDAAAQLSLRTASTGLTVTLGALIRSWLPPLVTGATGVGYQGTDIYNERDLDFDERFILRTGEGKVFYSADASTTANRRIIFDMCWEEFE